MINDVRNTVLSFLNKDNDGYMTPEQFNLWGKQAQLELHDECFYDLSIAINKTNALRHSSGDADIAKRLREVVNIFTDPTSLAYNGVTLAFDKPDNTYSLGTLVYNNTVEIEPVQGNKIYNLLASRDTAPTTTYPAYSVNTNGIVVYPSTITSNVVANRIRYPQDPKWTYTTFSGGEPLFDQSASDYQDFELPNEFFPKLVVRILSYSGISIKEDQVVNFAKNNEIQEKQEQK